jgi:hypothetical protein
MSTWTLVIMLMHPLMATVPGFSTEHECLAQAQLFTQVQERRWGGRIPGRVVTYCMEVK